MRFLRLVTAAALLGVAKTIEKASDIYDEAVEEIKKHPAETTQDKVEIYKQEIRGILEKGNPDFCNERRLETALNKLDKVQYFLSPFRQAKELEEVRETIDIYYRTVKIPNNPKGE